MRDRLARIDRKPLAGLDAGNLGQSKDSGKRFLIMLELVTVAEFALNLRTTPKHRQMLESLAIEDRNGLFRAAAYLFHAII